MKTFLLLFFASSSIFAQSYPGFKPLRYDENYEVLQTDSIKNNWYHTLKYLPVSKDRRAYFSFGGELRYQYFYSKNEAWGDGPDDADGYVLSRMLLHADFHPAKYVRAFLQLQSSNADGRLRPSPVDQNPLEVHQAFIDFNVIDHDKAQLTFRFGRQELSYGSQRLVAVRDGPNNRQSFDGAKAIFASRNYQSDFFFSHYVNAALGIFDDDSNGDRQLWGTYVVWNKIPLIRNLDFYYLGYKKTNAFFDAGTGKETRHSVGTRIWGKSGGFRYDCESVYQFGNYSHSEISAWTASANIGYRFTSIVLHPEIGLKAEVISGDKNTADKKLETFNPLFPRGAYFRLASLIGPSNLIDVHPSLNFELAKNLEWGIDYDMFWRYSKTDGIYAPNGKAIYPGNASLKKEIGRQLESEIIYQPNQYLYFRFEATWFDAGDFLKEASAGKDIFFTGVTTQLRF